MLVDTLLDKAPPWCSEEAPEKPLAVWSQCSIARNLSDFSFPARCSEDERRSVERRVLAVLEHLNLLSGGRYYSLPKLSLQEARFLAERHLITYELLCGNGPRGVYISEDQSLSIMVNGQDHLCIRVLCAGQQLEEAWSRLTLMDDTLSGMMDFAYDKRLGYLTASLGHVGTGLKASILLHLPALAQAQGVAPRAARAVEQRLTLAGVHPGGGPRPDQAGKTGARKGAASVESVERGPEQALYGDMTGALSCPIAETRGDLYLLVNQGALGLSEEEFLFRVRQAAKEIMDAERTARDALTADANPALADRVGRAHGLASGARVVSFTEALDWLSSIRLGIDAGLLEGHTVAEVNELLLRMQGAHLQIAKGGPCDALTLNAERATLLRGHFS